MMKHLRIRRSLRLVSVASVLPAMLACTSRSIHSDAEADPQVLLRRWTLPTHGPFEAGDRGSEYSNAVIHEGALIFGNESAGLVSLYPELGQVRWVLPIAGGVRSEILASGEAVYLVGGDGFVYSVNVETGRVNWRYEVRNTTGSRPTLAGGRLFVTTADDTVYAFDAGSGEWLWHYRRRTTSSASIHGASTPLVDSDVVMAGMSDGFLVGLSAQDGKLKWERKLHSGSKFQDVDAGPLREGSTVYVPSYDGALYALGAKDQQVQWKTESGGARQVLLSGNRVILPSSDGNVYALAKESGKTLWKFELDGGVPTRVVDTGPYLVFGSTDRYLYALDSSTGKLLYRYDAGYGSGFYGNPTFDSVNNQLFILSGAGNLYAFSVRSRKQNPRLEATSVRPYKFFDGSDGGF